jgi:hypothetical protein
VRLETVSGSIHCELSNDLNMRGLIRAGGRFFWDMDAMVRDAALEKQLDDLNSQISGILALVPPQERKLVEVWPARALAQQGEKPPPPGAGSPRGQAGGKEEPGNVPDQQVGHPSLYPGQEEDQGPQDPNRRHPAG